MGLIINIFVSINCSHCLIFNMGEQRPVDNQLFTKMFCSPLGDFMVVAARNVSQLEITTMNGHGVSIELVHFEQP